MNKPEYVCGKHKVARGRGRGRGRRKEEGGERKRTEGKRTEGKVSVRTQPT